MSTDKRPGMAVNEDEIERHVHETRGAGKASTLSATRRPRCMPRAGQTAEAAERGKHCSLE